MQPDYVQIQPNNALLNWWNSIWDSLNPFTAIARFIRGILQGFIRDISTFIFNTLEGQLEDFAIRLSAPPQSWPGFSLVSGIMMGPILTIAGAILAFMITVDLIQVLIDRNNSADFDASNLFKWIVKSVIMILIVTHSQLIVYGMFDIGIQAINNTTATIGTVVNFGEAQNQIDYMTDQYNEDVEIGTLMAVLALMAIMALCVFGLIVCMFLAIFGRFIEIMLIMSVAPIPLATLGNSSFNSMGFNYLKTLFAATMTGFFFITAFGIFTAMVGETLYQLDFTTAGGPVWSVVQPLFVVIGHLILLCFALFKIPNMAKSIFGAT